MRSSPGTRGGGGLLGVAAFVLTLLNVSAMRRDEIRIFLIFMIDVMLVCKYTNYIRTEICKSFFKNILARKDFPNFYL